MTSPTNMVKKCAGLVDTKDVTAWENAFLHSILRQTKDGDDTRPCVPLTSEKVKELICEHFVTGENLFDEVQQDYRFRSPGTERNVWGRDLFDFARAIEAAHNIKETKL